MDQRRKVGNQLIQQRGATCTAESELLWARGITDDPAYNLPDLGISFEHRHFGEHPGYVTGTAWVDGSLLYGRYAALRRGGWCFGTLTGNNERSFACYGLLPLLQTRQTILAAELWALYQ